MPNSKASTAKTGNGAATLRWQVTNLRRDDVRFDRAWKTDGCKRPNDAQVAAETEFFELHLGSSLDADNEDEEVQKPTQLVPDWAYDGHYKDDIFFKHMVKSKNISVLQIGRA